MSGDAQHRRFLGTPLLLKSQTPRREPGCHRRAGLSLPWPRRFPTPVFTPKRSLRHRLNLCPWLRHPAGPWHTLLPSSVGSGRACHPSVLPTPPWTFISAELKRPQAKSHSADGEDGGPWLHVFMTLLHSWSSQNLF